ncbi:MAG TPA: LLM class flavin-dependent oxidoreductase [Actinomycetota bacterium]|nr:LLM class flavin-dependent oxidoreductase [Actinomycetota bacterium]
MRQAERAGFDLIGIQDHPYQRRCLDTFSLLAALSTATERVGLFPDVASLPPRQPAMLARRPAPSTCCPGAGSRDATTGSWASSQARPPPTPLGSGSAATARGCRPSSAGWPTAGSRPRLTCPRAPPRRPGPHRRRRRLYNISGRIGPGPPRGRGRPPRRA